MEGIKMKKIILVFLLLIISINVNAEIKHTKVTCTYVGEYGHNSVKVFWKIWLTNDSEAVEKIIHIKWTDKNGKVLSGVEFTTTAPKYCNFTCQDFGIISTQTWKKIQKNRYVVEIKNTE